VSRSTVERADAPWVHGRGQESRFEQLHKAKVAVLGCGSVGAPVALQLAAAGVGQLLLIDPDKLRWANVGRHPLGATDVDRHKSSALAERILSSYPHALGVESLTCRWQDVGPDGPRHLEEADLVISTMGDWAAEGALNEWHRSHRKGIVVYGWTEAQACAGHAVAIRSDWGCLQCGFNPDGLPLLRVTEWPQGETVRQEPACGAVYQPYGPVELGHVVSVIAELAIDCILGHVQRATHRVWAARRQLLEGMGGTWTAEWEAIAAGRTGGGFVEEREWARSSSCIECKAGAA
jgi:sulfur-carrier protein adenylyltransferase/sulfurtransferase